MIEFPSFLGTYYNPIVVVMIATSGSHQFLTITSQSWKEDWLSSMQSLPLAAIDSASAELMLHHCLSLSSSVDDCIIPITSACFSVGASESLFKYESTHYFV